MPSLLSRFERLIARRYLRPKRSEGFVSLVSAFSFLGLLLGVGALVLVSSLMNGFRADLEQQLIGLDAHIEIQRKDGALIAADAPFLQTIRAYDTVQQASLVARDQVILVSDTGEAETVLLRGISQADFLTRPQVSTRLIAGDYQDFSDWSLMVSRQLAQRLRMGPGGQLDMISPLGNISPVGWTPRIKRLPIAGILSYMRDTPTVFMPQREAQIFLRQKGGGRAVEVFLTQPKQARAVRQALAAQLGPEYRVEDWMQLNATLVSALDVERLVVVVILGLIVLVAAFSIVSSQVMLVRSKGRGIAILRTMGASRGQVARAFVLAGLSLGLTGVFAGLALGLGIAAIFTPGLIWLEGLLQGSGLEHDIAYLIGMEPHVQTGQVIAFAIFALVVTVLATLYPAWRAASLDPVAALRQD